MNSGNPHLTLTKWICRFPTTLTRRCRATLSRSLLRQKRYGGQARGRGIFSPPIGWERGGKSKRTPIVFWKKMGSTTDSGVPCAIFLGEIAPG